MKKAKHTKVEGPFKSAVFGLAGFCLLISIGGFINGDHGAAIVCIFIGVAIGWLGSLIPNKNRVEW